MSSDTTDIESNIQKLLKENRLLKKKLDRSEINRAHLVEVHEKTQMFLAQTLAELEKASETIMKQKDRMETELNIGREIQMSMLPLIFPAFPEHKEFVIHSLLEPAREVGGDFYDFYFLSDRLFFFCIGDVSEKGVPAALFMAVIKTLVKSRAMDDFSPSSIITHVNDELSKDNDSCMFITLFCGIINVENGELVYTNAGHNPPLLKQADGKLVTIDDKHGPAVGALEGFAYQESRRMLKPDEILLMYTDGVTEAMDAGLNLFTMDRLEQLFTADKHGNVEHLTEQIITAVKEHEGESDRTDDVTVQAFKFNGGLEEDLVHKFEIIISNDLEKITKVAERFSLFARKYELPARVEGQVNMVLDELLNNAISYAFKDGEEHQITVKIRLLKSKLIIIIEDDGIPFNPLQLQKPNTELGLEEREISGLGIHLVRSVMDDVSYQRRVNKNLILLTKNLESIK